MHNFGLRSEVQSEVKQPLIQALLMLIITWSILKCPNKARTDQLKNGQIAKYIRHMNVMQIKQLRNQNVLLNSDRTTLVHCVYIHLVNRFIPTLVETTYILIYFFHRVLTMKSGRCIRELAQLWPITGCSQFYSWFVNFHKKKKKCVTFI